MFKKLAFFALLIGCGETTNIVSPQSTSDKIYTEPKFLFETWISPTSGAIQGVRIYDTTFTVDTLAFRRATEDPNHIRMKVPLKKMTKSIEGNMWHDYGNGVTLMKHEAITGHRVGDTITYYIYGLTNQWDTAYVDTVTLVAQPQNLVRL